MYEGKKIIYRLCHIPCSVHICPDPQITSSYFPTSSGMDYTSPFYIGYPWLRRYLKKKKKTW